MTKERDMSMYPKSYDEQDARMDVYGFRKQALAEELGEDDEHCEEVDVEYNRRCATGVYDDVSTRCELEHMQREWAAGRLYEAKLLATEHSCDSESFFSLDDDEISVIVAAMRREVDRETNVTFEREAEVARLRRLIAFFTGEGNAKSGRAKIDNKNGDIIIVF